MYEYLCEPWPLEGCCDFQALNISPAITGVAWQAASEALWLATGKVFGNCPVVLRPCRKDCRTDWPSEVAWASGVVDSAWDYPFPALIDGAWYNLACGSCSGDCSCTTTSEIVFPEYVNDLVSVVQDGVTLVENVDYQLLDRTRLVRMGDDWPMCQDWHVTGGPGTLFVTTSFGEDVPALGRLAAAALTCEIAKLCAGQECGLPSHAISMTRQGVTFRGTGDFLEKGLTGVYLADFFITRVNPKGYPDRMRAHSVDVTHPTAVRGT